MRKYILLLIMGTILASCGTDVYTEYRVKNLTSSEIQMLTGNPYDSNRVLLKVAPQGDSLIYGGTVKVGNNNTNAVFKRFYLFNIFWLMDSAEVKITKDLNQESEWDLNGTNKSYIYTLNIDASDW